MHSMQANLGVALGQDDAADGLLVLRAKDVLQVLMLGQQGLAHVGKHAGGLQHLVQVLLPAFA